MPKSARSLSVSHPQYGVLRDWTFPESLETGTYTMKLDYQEPGKTAGRRTVRKVQRPAPGTVLPSSLDWQLYAGTGLIDGKAGLDAGLR